MDPSYQGVTDKCYCLFRSQPKLWFSSFLAIATGSDGRERRQAERSRENGDCENVQAVKQCGAGCVKGGRGRLTMKTKHLT